MLEKVEVERKSGMPGWQKCRLHVSLRLQQLIWTEACVFENSPCKEVKLLRVESEKLNVHWILLQRFI